MNNVLIRMKPKSSFGGDFVVKTKLSYVEFVRQINQEGIVKKPSIGIRQTFVPVTDIAAIHRA